MPPSPPPFAFGHLPLRPLPSAPLLPAKLTRSSLPAGLCRPLLRHLGICRYGHYLQLLLLGLCLCRFAAASANFFFLAFSAFSASAAAAANFFFLAFAAFSASAAAAANFFLASRSVFFLAFSAFSASAAAAANFFLASRFLVSSQLPSQLPQSSLPLVQHQQQHKQSFHCS